MCVLNRFQRQLGVRLPLGLMALIGMLGAVPASAQQNPEIHERPDAVEAQNAVPIDSKADSFLATKPSVPRTVAFINDALVGKLRYLGQHNPAGKVLLGKSQLHLKDDRNRHPRRVVKFETPVLEDMSNASNSPRSHLSVATALQDELNIEAARANGDYVLIPCKKEKKCVDNRLLLSSTYDQPPSSLPGIGALMKSVWAPPSVLVVGPFEEGQAVSMVPVVQYLLSERLVPGLSIDSQARETTQ